MARALECDEDKERFEAKLGKIAKHKSEPKELVPPEKKAASSKSRRAK